MVPNKGVLRRVNKNTSHMLYGHVWQMLPIEILPFSANAPTVSQSRGVRSSLARVDRSRRDNILFTILRGCRVRLGETGERSESSDSYKTRYFIIYMWDSFSSEIDDEEI